MKAEPAILEASSGRSRRSLFGPGLLALALFSMGHFSVDMYSSALSVFQPLLGSRLGLSFSQAGWLAGVLVFSSSVTQPLYGYLSDRFQSRLFSALAPAAAAVFLTLVGLATGYAWAMLAVLVGGAGISSFHPQAAARATAAIDRNKGRWMAVFISAGTLGVGFGPLYFSFLVEHVNLRYLPWAALPGVLMSVLLFTAMPRTTWSAGAIGTKFDFAPLRAFWKPLALLYLLVFIRSIVQVTFTQFLPLYLSRERGLGIERAALALTIFLTAGALGGFAGGHLADRFGGRRIILISMIGSVPFLLAFLFGPASIGLVSLGLGGLILLFAIPVNVVIAQNLVPSQAGTVSALMMGFAWGTAGLVFIPLTGWLSDHYSLHTALSAVALFPLAGYALSWKLPKDE
jgi:MFS transporter, FSR family, fosmidomycin resistance protein